MGDSWPLRLKQERELEIVKSTFVTIGLAIV